MYSYVENNPVNWIDRYGNEPMGDDDQSGGGWGSDGEADDFGEDGYTGPDESAHEAEGWGFESSEKDSLFGGLICIGEALYKILKKTTVTIGKVVAGGFTFFRTGNPDPLARGIEEIETFLPDVIDISDETEDCCDTR